jgi:hypothetical protein
MNAFAHNFTIGAAINPSVALRMQTPMTMEALQHYAPSAFATAAHESRSDRYTYIPTSEIIAGLMREGFQPFSATQSRCRIAGKSDFTKHMIRFRHPDSFAAIQKVGDSVPEVVLVNSHDGTSAYKLSAGLYRLVCSNGLMVSDSTVQMVKVQHKGNIVDQVIEGSFEIVQQSEKALARADEWNQLQLTAGEQAAFADAARTLRFADAEGEIKTPITAGQLLRPRRDADAPERAVTDWRRPAVPKPDLWHTLNVVQENVIRGGLSNWQQGIDQFTGRKTARRVTTREVRGIDQDVKLNRALWMLAEKMAELKGQAVAA